VNWLKKSENRRHGIHSLHRITKKIENIYLHESCIANTLGQFSFSVTSMACSLPGSPWNGQADIPLLKTLTLLRVHTQAFKKFYTGNFFKHLSTKSKFA
jgi:hypothetical protein